MNHGSLFTGIGGFDLAAERMGWTNKFHCEWNPFGQKVLKHYWPEAESYSDITKTDFTLWRGKIDILTGGFPCQPYSTAGKRLGKEDDRHLWPEMHRAIREIQPRYVVGENVSGLINWNGGLVFEEVQAELEAEGYEVRPFILPAAGVGAPHRRDRVWFVAYSFSARTRNQSKSISDQRRISSENRGNSLRQIHGETLPSGFNSASPNDQFTPDSPSDRRQREGQGIETEEGLQSRSESTRIMEGGLEGLCESGATAYSSGPRLQEWEQGGRREDSKETRTGLDDRSERSGDFWNAPHSDSQFGCERRLHENGREEAERYVGTCDACSDGRTAWDHFPTQSPICTGDDGFPTGSLRQRIREDSLGHLSEKEIDKILSSARTEWRNETIKAAGNAIVHQVAVQIFQAIDQFENIFLTESDLSI